jgi:hypothetical protein
MDQTRYYPGTFDVSQLAAQLTTQLQMRNYQAQWFGAGTQVMVQVRKGGEAAKVFGAQAALSVMLTQQPQGVLATLGQQAWGDKAIAAGVGALILWPLLVPAAVGAARQSNLPGEVLTLLDVLVAQQHPGAAPAALPAYLAPQVQQMYQPPPPAPPPPPAAPQQRVCPACQRLNSADAAFCQYCATPLSSSAAPNVGMPAAPPPPPPPAWPMPSEATERYSPEAEATVRVAASSGPTGIFTLPSGRQVSFAEEAVIGRSNPDGSQMVEVDMTAEPERATVSRRHARVTRSGSAFELEDLNSANQTKLNNQPLTPGKRYPLRGGDVVEFGKVRCTFLVQDG